MVQEGAAPASRERRAPPSRGAREPARDPATHLWVAAAALRALVERSTGADGTPVLDDGAVADYREQIDAATRGPDGWHSLARLCGSLRLTLLERDILLLAAAVQLDPELCAALPGTAGGQPTFGLAFALFGESEWSATSPASALSRYRLVALEASEFLLRAPIRIAENVLAHLLGGRAPSGRLWDLVEPVEVPAFLPPTHQRAMERSVAMWSQSQSQSGAGREPISVIQLAGEERGVQRAIAALTCAKLGFGLGALRAADVPANVTDRVGLARLAELEWATSSTVLLLDLTDDSDEASRAAMELAEVAGAPLFLATREPVALRRSNTARIDVGRTSAREAIEVWRHTLPPDFTCPPDDLERIAAQFRASAAAAGNVAAGLRGSLVPGAAPDEVARALHDACRVGARRGMSSLAQRISSTVGWNDLVLPAPTTRKLREITAQLKHRTRVYETWGFADRSDRGLGVSALFHGDSGTGKTLAAEVMANELELDLFRVDLSRVVSKYIGETEKNLRRIFDAAEESGAILLFDEADSLFGKRSEVKDSHDRYANLEVSYLLSRMETYRGLAILTTNFKDALDQAFLRRIRFMVQFPFPDAAQRAAIWSRAFPERTPTSRLDPAVLARLSVTGGSIRNIALGAAFLAADAGEPVTPVHVLRAATTEYAKLNKALTESETRGWQ
jgi:hypothetical protein